MKIRPKPRKYNREDLDESYFATNSCEGDVNLSQQEVETEASSDKS